MRTHITLGRIIGPPGRKSQNVYKVGGGGLPEALMICLTYTYFQDDLLNKGSFPPCQHLLGHLQGENI